MALTKDTEIVKPIYENIPEEMKQLPRWVCWRSEEKKDKNGKIKLTKVPYQATNLYKASATNKKTWSTFENAVTAFEEKGFDGLGFMLGEGIIGIDIDDCINEKGEPSDLVTEIVQTVDSYYEKSVSGKGVHILLKGELPKGYMNKNTALDIEVYGSARYFTMTGKTGQKKSLNEDPLGLINVLEKYFKRKPKKKHSPQISYTNMSNSELWEKMFNSKSGQAIRDLYNGHLINDDHSSSDLALCNHLAFWTNKNPLQMDSMFRESGLMRDKWDRKTGNTTYGMLTIQRAIDDTSSVIGERKVNSPKIVINENTEDDPLSQLEYTKNGEKVLSNARNAELILTSDPFKDILAFDAFKNMEAIRGDLPWRKRERPFHKYEPWLSSDDQRLQHYFGKLYDFKSVNIIKNAYIEVSRQNSFHPVKEYIESQVWDGSPRAETVFIDYLGANDSDYVRAVTRKWLTAAVARIYDPGCKFDYMPVLVGPQGAKKSSTIAKLARDWFSDSLKNFESKDAGEHLQSSWIFEFGELAAMKKSEVEEIKHFVTKTIDKYRVAYDRVVSEFPRKCVFIGTTNKHDFLRDKTGNRRFWAIVIDPKKRKYDPAVELTDEIVGQIWAEAMHYYKLGEKLYLDQALEEEAAKIQEQHMEEDPRTGLIQKYLNAPLPSHWDSMSIFERRSYLDRPTGDTTRTKVCAAEVWCECLENDIKNMKVHDAREICDIIRKTEGWKERKPSRISFKHYGKQTAFIKEDSKK